MIDYEKLDKALKHLELQLANYQGRMARNELTELDREAIAESVIQRFETGYDSLWKTLKRYLAEELGLAELPNSPKPLLRIADRNGLLPSPVEKWLEYADARTGTAHDYSGEKAQDVLAIAGEFTRDAIRLYDRMTGNSRA